LPKFQYFYLSSDKKKYIHYEVIKNVVPFTTLFIHGNLSSNRWWYPLIGCIQENGASGSSGDIILAEIRGCGQSSDVNEAESISIDLLAQEFGDLVNHLNYPSLNVVGHSTGGSIAFALLAKQANKSHRVVLVDPVGARGRRFDLSMLSAFQKMKTDPNLVAEVMKITIRSPLLSQHFFQDVVVPDAVRAARVMGLKIAQAFGEFNCVEKLGQIRTPVLILHGDQDQVLPLSDSKELSELIPGARLEVLTGMGHCPNLEDPNRLWLAIRSFLFS
jgi:3-oxoadipate enol-lactonase